MSQWFRFYASALNDPKVQRLSGDLFKAWVNMLCLACENDGRLSCVADIAFGLRIPEARAQKTVEEFVLCGLLDEDGEGGFTPHNWDGRQFKSDSSSERVKRYRQRQCNVTDDVTVTPPEQNRADTESEGNVTELRSDDYPRDFREQFWQAYPRKQGKAAAIRKLEVVRKSGKITFAALMAAVDRYAHHTRTLDPKYIKHPATWLNAGCWDDELPPARSVAANGQHYPEGII